MSEHEEQKAFFQEVDIRAKSDPRWANIFAIPNGAWTKNEIAAIKLKREGLKSGVFDVFVAVPVGKYHGLFLEFKYRNNKLSDNQLEWREKFRAFGYATAIAWSGRDGIKLVSRYFKHT